MGIVAQAKAALSQEHARQEQAQREAERLKSLVNGKAISQREYDEAVSTLRQSTAAIEGAQAKLAEAQLNLSYCLATLLLEGDVFVDQFSQGMLADPARLALAAKVEVREDRAITARGAKFRHMVSVTVHLAGGDVLEETVESPRGSERNFPSVADVVAKFTKLAGRTMAPRQVERIVKTVLDLDEIGDMGVLLNSLTPATAD